MTSDGQYRIARERDRLVAKRQYERWLQAPNADLSVDALSFDKVGIWFHLLPDGRTEWARRISQHPAPSPWTIDVEPSAGTVVVHACDAQAAHCALTERLMLHPQFEVRPEHVVARAVPSFRLRDGTIVNGGVQISAELVNKGRGR
jgi:hypothetical protein